LFRRVRLAPGLTLNLTTRGASLSAGVRGAHVTVGRTGIRRTVGIPGTGVFYTSHTGLHSGIHTAGHFAGAKTAPAGGISSKNVLVALLLCLFLGPLGAHRFYVGRWASGALMLLLALTVYGAILVVIWWLFDFLIIVTGNFTDSHDDRIRW
jgi:hypothetical protein